VAQVLAKNYSLPYQKRGTRQQNTYRPSEKPGENPRHNTSDIKHYRVLIAQTEPTAKGTNFRDLKGKKTNITITLYSLQKYPETKGASVQPVARLQAKGKHIGEHRSIVTQTTQAIFDCLHGDFICLIKNIL